MSTLVISGKIAWYLNTAYIIKDDDNKIPENYKELVENHESLESSFQKYKESQKFKGYKNTVLLNQQQDEIDNKISKDGGCLLYTSPSPRD